MKLPRNASGVDLVKALGRLGYFVVRQRSSHIRLTTQQHGVHHVTVPDHNPIKTGTLNGILNDVASHFGLTRDELLQQLFD